MQTQSNHDEKEPISKTIEEGTQLLSNTYLFQGLDFDTVRSIFEAGEVEFYKKGSHPVIEGDPTIGLYMIIQGNLAVFKQDKINNQRHKIAELKKGDAFGELSLFTEQPRVATITCESNTTLFFLGKDAYATSITNADSELRAVFYKNCLESLSSRLISLNQDFLISQQQLWKYALGTKLQHKIDSERNSE